MFTYSINIILKTYDELIFPSFIYYLSGFLICIPDTDRMIPTRKKTMAIENEDSKWVRVTMSKSMDLSLANKLKMMSSSSKTPNCQVYPKPRRLENW